jgi:uncharacterized protein (TIGR03000 family)
MRIIEQNTAPLIHFQRRFAMKYQFLISAAVAALLLSTTSAVHAQKGGGGGGRGGAPSGGRPSGASSAHMNNGHSHNGHNHNGGYYHNGHYPYGSGFGIGIGLYPSLYGSSYLYPNGYGYPYDYPYIAPRVAYYPQTIIVQGDSGGPVSTAASVRVLVPNPQAKVLFDGNVTKQEGTDRLFHTPTLTGAASYRVRAIWTENGRETVQEAVASVRPGETTLVDFTKAAPEEGPPRLPK